MSHRACAPFIQDLKIDFHPTVVSGQWIRPQRVTRAGDTWESSVTSNRRVTVSEKKKKQITRHGFTNINKNNIVMLERSGAHNCTKSIRQYTLNNRRPCGVSGDLRGSFSYGKPRPDANSVRGLPSKNKAFYSLEIQHGR